MANKFKKNDTVKAKIPSLVQLDKKVFVVKDVVDDNRVIIEFSKSIIAGVDTIITLVVNSTMLEIV